MKLVTFVYNGATRFGALHPFEGKEKVIDLHQIDANIPNDIITFLEAGDSARSLAQKALEKAAGGLDLSAVKLKAPIPRPGKIICIGLNYADHAAESGLPIPDFPVVFAKYANTVIGQGDSIVLPKVSKEVDYEAELGFVIGKRGRYIAEKDALNYIAGYLPVNDVSARDYQMRTSQWTMGKTFDTFAPMGPALVTTDEIPDPQNLDIKLTINGEVLQNSNTKQLIFGIAQLVSSLSEVITLEPGDIVSTGTPPGVGAARKPQRFLQPGETVDVYIEKLGTLSNPVIAER